MSDHFWAKIWIGGPMPDHLMGEFRQKLDEAGLFPADGDLSECAEGRDGSLAFEDSEATYGWFEDLEEWLVLNGIEFNRQSDSYFEVDACLVAFRREQGQREFVLDHNGYHVIRVDSVLNLIDNNPDLGSLILELRREAGQDLTALKPFFGTPASQAIAADELKRRNTNPAVTECVQCGGRLSDPGMGPSYKHCPKCEP
jgi:hypothetical protein